MPSAAQFIVKLFRFKRYLKVSGFEFANYNKILRILADSGEAGG